MQTKIYGTIGPACQNTDTLVRLFEEGMTGVRINLSHMSLEDASEWIANIHNAYRRANEQQGKRATEASHVKVTDDERQANAGMIDELEILIDLQGPELRIGKLSTARILEVGDGITLVAEGQNNLFDPTEIPVPELILPHLQPEQKILLNDGKILLKIEELYCTNTGCTAECTVLRGGKLESRKSIAIPEAELYPPTLTNSDLNNIRLAKKYGVTGVMLPFVRNRGDLQNLKQALTNEGAADIRIFAKIENMDGVERLMELLPECDEIVIARGDLGNALPLWDLPVVQARIAKMCRMAGKPFMVVTQMLASMEHSAVPSRAEVSDIFRAVQEGAGSVMLTGETAAGEYPVESMRYMARTVEAAERYLAEKWHMWQKRCKPLT